MKALKKDIQKSILRISFILFLFFLYNKSYPQGNVTDVTGYSKEIILWINNFENNNSVERIMQGTTEDKVNLEYEDGKIIINSMLWRMGRQPEYIRGILNIKDIVSIEALKKNNEGNVIVSFQICSTKDSILMECKDFKNSNFSKCYWYDDEMYEKYGFCSSELRFKFSAYSANEEIDRVYKALKELVVINGGNPRVGSLF